MDSKCKSVAVPKRGGVCTCGKQFIDYLCIMYYVFYNVNELKG